MKFWRSKSKFFFTKSCGLVLVSLNQFSQNSNQRLQDLANLFDASFLFRVVPTILYYVFPVVLLAGMLLRPYVFGKHGQVLQCCIDSIVRILPILSTSFRVRTSAKDESLVHGCMIHHILDIATQLLT